MEIKRKAIDRRYFEEDVKKFIEDKGIKREDVINVTDDGINFTTLWYWGNN